ncbi:MAG: DUF456 domain-containing protein [Planctomycetota bacterium]|nr:DUF456 domain-containing protein [Planctomycetota bacterium]
MDVAALWHDFLNALGAHGPYWLVGIGMLIAGCVGVVLSALTLPGAWCVILVALLMQWWQPGTFSWWTIGVCIGLAALGEVLEMLASAAGASKAGSSKRGALASVVGSVGGALVGTVLIPIPLLGTLIGAVAGAAGGALLVERGVVGKTWQESREVAKGAAVGRLWATVAKLGVTITIALTLIIAAFV